MRENVIHTRGNSKTVLWNLSCILHPCDLLLGGDIFFLCFLEVGALRFVMSAHWCFKNVTCECLSPRVPSEHNMWACFALLFVNNVIFKKKKINFHFGPVNGQSLWPWMSVNMRVVAFLHPTPRLIIGTVVGCLLVWTTDGPLYPFAQCEFNLSKE